MSGDNSYGFAQVPLANPAIERALSENAKSIERKIKESSPDLTKLNEDVKLVERNLAKIENMLTDASSEKEELKKLAENVNTIKDGVKQAMDENNLKVEGYLTAGLGYLNSRLDELVSGGNRNENLNLNSRLNELMSGANRVAQNIEAIAKKTDEHNIALQELSRTTGPDMSDEIARKLEEIMVTDDDFLQANIDINEKLDRLGETDDQIAKELNDLTSALQRLEKSDEKTRSENKKLRDQLEKLKIGNLKSTITKDQKISEQDVLLESLNTRLDEVKNKLAEFEQRTVEQPRTQTSGVNNLAFDILLQNQVNSEIHNLRSDFSNRVEESFTRRHQRDLVEVSAAAVNVSSSNLSKIIDLAKTKGPSISILFLLVAALLSLCGALSLPVSFTTDLPIESDVTQNFALTSLTSSPLPSPTPSPSSASTSTDLVNPVSANPQFRYVPYVFETQYREVGISINDNNILLNDIFKISENYAYASTNSTPPSTPSFTPSPFTPSTTPSPLLYENEWPESEGNIELSNDSNDPRLVKFAKGLALSVASFGSTVQYYTTMSQPALFNAAFKATTTAKDAYDLLPFGKTRSGANFKPSDLR